MFKHLSRLLALFSVISTLGCSTARNAEHNALATKVADRIQPDIISFEDDFRHFWSLAKDQSIKRQLELWDDVIEKKHQDFYDSVVWEKRTHPHWSELKRRVLAEQFKKYELLYPKIVERFESFSQVTTEEFNKFARSFPDAKLDFPVYAVPSPTFNAKGAILGTDRVILAFGIDTFLAIHDKYEIVYPHELFHVYHALKSGFRNDGVMPDVSITVPLWAEGMAVYVSSLFNPGASDADLLEDAALGRLPISEGRDLARLFINEADAKAIDSNHPEIFKKWFSVSKLRVRPDLPNRCGYFLGLQVVRHIAKTHSLAEMASWKPKEANYRVLIALEELAGAP